MCTLNLIETLKTSIFNLKDVKLTKCYRRKYIFTKDILGYLDIQKSRTVIFTCMVLSISYLL